jgi:hypothetical protein
VPKSSKLIANTLQCFYNSRGRCGSILVSDDTIPLANLIHDLSSLLAGKFRHLFKLRLGETLLCEVEKRTKYVKEGNALGVLSELRP